LVNNGWRLPFQDIAGELVVNILELVDGLDIGQLNILVNVEELAMWPEFIAVSARLPMPGKVIMFQEKIYCPIALLLPELKPNSISSAQWLTVLPAILPMRMLAVSAIQPNTFFKFYDSNKFTFFEKTQFFTENVFVKIYRLTNYTKF
jgi:hypothetical protein